MYPSASQLFPSGYLINISKLTRPDWAPVISLSPTLSSIIILIIQMKNLRVTGFLLCLIPPHSSINIFISTAFKCWRNSTASYYLYYSHLIQSKTIIHYFNCFLTVESASFLVPLQSLFHISQNEPVNLQVGLFHLSLENLPVGSCLNQRKLVMVTARQHPLLTSGLDCLSDLISDTSAPGTHG